MIVEIPVKLNVIVDDNNNLSVTKIADNEHVDIKIDNTDVKDDVIGDLNVGVFSKSSLLEQIKYLLLDNIQLDGPIVSVKEKSLAGELNMNGRFMCLIVDTYLSIGKWVETLADDILYNLDKDACIITDAGRRHTYDNQINYVMFVKKKFENEFVINKDFCVDKNVVFL